MYLNDEDSAHLIQSFIDKVPAIILTIRYNLNWLEVKQVEDDEFELLLDELLEKDCVYTEIPEVSTYRIIPIDDPKQSVEITARLQLADALFKILTTYGGFIGKILPIHLTEAFMRIARDKVSLNIFEDPGYSIAFYLEHKPSLIQGELINSYFDTLYGCQNNRG